MSACAADFIFLVEVTRIGSRLLLGWTEDNPIAQGFSFDVRGSALSAAANFDTCRSQSVLHREPSLSTIKALTSSVFLLQLCVTVAIASCSAQKGPAGEFHLRVVGRNSDPKETDPGRAVANVAVLWTGRNTDKARV